MSGEAGRALLQRCSCTETFHGAASEVLPWGAAQANSESLGKNSTPPKARAFQLSTHTCASAACISLPSPKFHTTTWIDPSTDRTTIRFALREPPSPFAPGILSSKPDCPFLSRRHCFAWSARRFGSVDAIRSPISIPIFS